MRPHPCELRILPFYVYSILSKKEREESFISILNLPSFALRHPRNLLCLFFPPKQKLEREKTCVVHVLVLWVEKFGFQRAFAFHISLQQTRVFAFLSSSPLVAVLGGRQVGSLEKPICRTLVSPGEEVALQKHPHRVCSNAFFLESESHRAHSL